MSDQKADRTPGSDRNPLNGSDETGPLLDAPGAASKSAGAPGADAPGISPDETQPLDETQILDETQASLTPGPLKPGAPPPVPPASNTPASGSTPERIGSYRIVREIGRGGMGLVYLAEDPRLGRRVALKILPQHLAEDPAAFARFKDEARLLAQMNHPNIATIHSLEADEPLHFLTMELIAGETLQSRLTETPLSVGEWLLFSRQIAAALEGAHASGIIHLDLKPGNVMITPDGIVKVLDFGLAIAAGRETDESEGARTRAQAQETVSGTPGYMSPEQVMGKSVDSRADIFAFGSVLYESMTCHQAFEGATVRERVRATLTREPDLALLPAELPESMRDLIRRCLVKDPNRRLASITQALEELDLAAQGGAAPKTRSTPNNLPTALSKFVGRGQAKDEVKDLLAHHTILTVTGVGGGGKTRFVLEVGRDLLSEFPDGVWLVEIAPLADESRVPDELLTVLGLKEEVGRNLIDTLVDHLSEKSSLLLFDGCERFPTAAASLVNALHRRCPHLRTLCASREPLALSGEAVYQLPALSIPRGGSVRPSLDELARFEAVQLFVDRASATRPGFELTTENAPAVLQICQQLDGIPLALELAAARIRVLSPADIARRLDDRFRLLTSSERGVLPYHKTLRALIDWSHDHLSPEEQSVFRRLAVFAGGWTLEAAERVGTGPDLDEWELLDHLTNLVEKCLVEVDSDASQRTGQTRYRMLGTIRAYAREKLDEAGDEATVRVAHRELFLKLAEDAEVELAGPEQARWLAHLAEDHDNFLVALETEESAEERAIGLQLAGALGRYWLMRGHWSEARSIYGRLLDGGDIPETLGAANALNWAGNLSKSQSDYPSARVYLEGSLDLNRRLDDQVGVARSLHNLGNVVKDLGDIPRARELYEEGLALQESLGNRANVALSYNGLGALALQEGDHERARAFFEQSLSIRRELGNPGAIADSLNNLGWIALADGRLEDAVAQYEESLSIYRELGNLGGIAASLHNLGGLAEKKSELEAARGRYEESLAIHRDLGDRGNTARTLHGLATLQQTLGRPEESHALFLESAEILAEVGDLAALSRVLEEWAALFADQGDLERGLQLLGVACELLGAETKPALLDEDRWIRVREKAGAEEFVRLYEIGRNVSVPAALALARKVPGDGAA